ncbi:hypothetical protein HK098_002893 [Nowakowskiella sp. JEL0407]|nr:hypothetical protein HK098_002893 [Nowakowskiella sp. JEL0407]
MAVHGMLPSAVDNEELPAGLKDVVLPHTRIFEVFKFTMLSDPIPGLGPLTQKTNELFKSYNENFKFPLKTLNYPLWWIRLLDRLSLPADMYGYIASTFSLLHQLPPLSYPDFEVQYVIPVIISTILRFQIGFISSGDGWKPYNSPMAVSWLKLSHERNPYRNKYDGYLEYIGKFLHSKSYDDKHFESGSGIDILMEFIKPDPPIPPTSSTPKSPLPLTPNPIDVQSTLPNSQIRYAIYNPADISGVWSTTYGYLLHECANIIGINTFTLQNFVARDFGRLGVSVWEYDERLVC